jgi:hypothetical protein
MSNFLDGVFTPRYTWSSVSGFETRLDTSLAGNTTIGDSTTNYSLLLNGLPIISGSDISSWSLYPAVSQVNLSLHDLSGIISFNGVGAKFNSSLTAIGSNAGSGNTGSYVNAFGCNAANGNTGSNVVAIGYQAAFDNSGSAVVAIGINVANCNIGSNVNAIGNSAAYQNSGDNVNAIGLSAAYQNLGSNVNAIGYYAANYNSGDNVNAIGSNTAESNVGWFVNAIGNLAASNNTSDHVNAFGTAAASGNSGGNVNAIGNNAATNNTGSYVNAFGCNAGIGNTGNNCTFIGKNQYLSVNNLSDRLIVYSSSNNPLLYGDTSNMSLGIGTTTLSAALTVSGKICATGILDTLNSTGTANQVLTAGTGGGGLVWANNYPYIWQFSVNIAATIAPNGYVINYVPVYSNNSNPMTNTGTAQTIAITGYYQINFVPFITSAAITAGTPPIWQLTMTSNGNQFATSTFVGATGEFGGAAPTMTGCGYLAAGTNVNVTYIYNSASSPDALDCSVGTSITYILLSP